MPLPEVKILVTTFAKEADATSAVRTLVHEKLAACGTLLHRARSIYVWHGHLEDTEEIVVWLKTTAARAEAAAARLREIHPYETPEILLLSAESASPSYTEWLSEAVSDRDTHFH